MWWGFRQNCTDGNCCWALSSCQTSLIYGFLPNGLSRYKTSNHLSRHNAAGRSNVKTNGENISISYEPECRVRHISRRILHLLWSQTRLPVMLSRLRTSCRESVFAYGMYPKRRKKHNLYSGYRTTDSFIKTNGENMNKEDYRICPEAGPDCYAKDEPDRICPHSYAHMERWQSCTDGNCGRRGKRLSCVKASERQIVLARLTGKIWVN